MPTREDAIHGLLLEPFKDVRTRPQGGRQLSYITARQVMNRLDDVVGGPNWCDEYQVIGNDSVICRLTITYPDGTKVTKSDAGGVAGMADAGDDDKSGFSDAFKRAAVKFGVGRHLYQDGLPEFINSAEYNPDGPRPAPKAPAPRRAPAQQPTRQPGGSGNGGGGGGGYNKFAIPESGKAFRWAKQMEEHFGVSLLNGLTKAAKEMGHPEDTRKWDDELNRELCLRAMKMLAGRDNYQGEFDSILNGPEGETTSEEGGAEDIPF